MAVNKMTVDHAVKIKKLYLVLDLEAVNTQTTINMIGAWTVKGRIKVLNVAGLRLQEGFVAAAIAKKILIEPFGQQIFGFMIQYRLRIKYCIITGP